MHVFVLSIDGKALMPTLPSKARKLLRDKKAVIVGYKPFTIQLTYKTKTEIVQPVTIGVDTGAKFIGIAIESEGKILAKGEIELRTDVSKLLMLRNNIRRARRLRILRYRKARFSNRGRPKGWLPPSTQSRIDNTIMWVKKFRDLVPNPKVVVEVGKFDIQKMENEDIKGYEYQEGATYGYYNNRYYVLARDNYKCQICNGKSKDKILRTHHIRFKSNGGSDRVKNLATICDTCHDKYHKGKVKHEFKKPKRYSSPIFMNILRKHIINRLDCELTYGYITITDRRELGLDKSHINDAISITGIKKIVKNNASLFIIKQFRKKRRSLHSVGARKRKSKNITQIRNETNRKFSKGFYRGDSVMVNGERGYIYGLTKRGLALVRDINKKSIKMPNQKGMTINFKYLQFICHNNNWHYDIV